LISEYPSDTPADLLAEHLRELNVEYVHFHHTLGFKPDVWRLPELLGVPYDVMIHDYYLVCPRINLIDESGIYCGQPESAACERCVKGMPLEHDTEERLDEMGGTVALWRQFHMTQLKGARQIVTPSQNARTHIQKYLPIQHIEAISHPEPDFTWTPREWDGNFPHRIAILGAIGPHKGANLLLACAKYALRENLPVHFVVIGYTDRDEVFADLDNVEITGPYEPDELPSLVEDTGCRIALFLSVWPETFSYTLSEAWRLGLYPVALDIGAPAERIRESKLGCLIPFTDKPNEIMKELMNTLNLQESNYISSALHTQVTATEPYES
jgi:glycosyltransferase involved in cell wall biosynthesis